MTGGSRQGAGSWTTLAHGALVVGRINLFLLLPGAGLILLSCALGLGGGHADCAEVVPFAIGVFTLVNTACVLVVGFFSLPLRPLRPEGWRWWMFLGLVVLPSLALVAALGGHILLAVMFPGMIRAGVFRLFLFCLVVAQLCGLSLQAGTEFQLRLARAAAALEESRGRQRELSLDRDRAQADALRALIQPHFLFNALNTLAGLIPAHPGRAEDVVVRLARVFRRTLDAGSDEWTSLSDELGVAADFLEIERARMGDRLSYRFEVPDGLRGVTVPTLILQPLVENAVKHGVFPTGGPGLLRVRALQRGARCRIEVVDDGVGFGDSDVDGHGLSLVRDRLRLHFGPGHGPFVERVGRETVVGIEVPAVA